MAFLFIFTMLLPIIVLLCSLFRNKNGVPTNWPIVGMLPAVLKNIHRLNDFIIEIGMKSYLTFSFNGPWSTDMRHYIVSVDPSNVHHVLSKKFDNYVKGSKLNEILEPLGNGFINADATLWLYQRNVALSFFNHPRFHKLLVDVTLKKIQSGLIPILDHASKEEMVIDMQDIFLRFMYDNMCIIMLNYELMSLSIEMPSFPLLSAIGDLGRAMIYRHVVPVFVWKFLKWLNVGYERKVKSGGIILDNLIYNCIDRKRKERNKKASKLEVQNHNNEADDLLTYFMEQDENEGAPIRNDNDKFLRDIIVNFFLAGAETTSIALSWFFCLLSKNPRVLKNIKIELEQVLNKNDESVSTCFSEISSKLIYLHAALYESMRLYPSLPFNPKAPIELDILPSGHKVNKNTQIFFNLYAMGRTKSIWGEDCCEFKPERWLTPDGKIKHEPSYKFNVFGAGPRSCLGKQMAITQIKIVAATIIQKYEIEAVEKYHEPQVSIVLRIKHGFKAKVFRT